jgi:hypothetical protein
MKQDIAKQHVALRDQLRKQFQDTQISEADLFYESAKLFKPITESTEKALQKLPLPAPAPAPVLPALPAAAALPALAAPALPVLSALPAPAAPPPPAAAKPEYAVINPDAGLDVELLEEMGFQRPSKITDPDKYEEIIQKVNYYNRYVLGREKRGSVSEESKDSINEKIEANKDYVKRLRLLIGGTNLIVQGKGLKLVGN